MVMSFFGKAGSPGAPTQAKPLLRRREGHANGVLWGTPGWSPKSGAGPCMLMIFFGGAGLVPGDGAAPRWACLPWDARPLGESSLPPLWGGERRGV